MKYKRTMNVRPEIGTGGDVTGLMGQYCHGNEPSHHNIYFFTLLSRRDLAAKYIREVTDFTIRHEDILKGGELIFEMSPSGVRRAKIL